MLFESSEVKLKDAWNAKLEQNFKELGNNPTGKKVNQKLKTKNGQKRSGYGSLDVDWRNENFVNIGMFLPSNIPNTTFPSKKNGEHYGSKWNKFWWN